MQVGGYGAASPTGESGFASRLPLAARVCGSRAVRVACVRNTGRDRLQLARTARNSRCHT